MDGIKRVMVTAATVLASTSWAACTTSSDTEPDVDEQPAVTITAAGSASVLSENSVIESGTGIGIFGYLSIVDGCLGLATSTGGVVVIFPPGTTTSGEDEHTSVTLPGLRSPTLTLEIGDFVEGGSRNNETQPVSSFGFEPEASLSCIDHAAYPGDEFERADPKEYGAEPPAS